MKKKVKTLVPEIIPTEKVSPMQEVRKILEAFGFRVRRINNGGTGRIRRANVYDKGLSDFISTRQGRVLFIEVKKGEDKLSPEQKTFLLDVDNCVSFSTCVYVDKDREKFTDWIKRII